MMSCGHLWITKVTSTLVWLALDMDSREIVGVAIGARNETAARSSIMEFLASGIPPRRDTRGTRHAFGRSLTPIFGKHTQQFYPASAIER